MTTHFISDEDGGFQSGIHVSVTPFSFFSACVGLCQESRAQESTLVP